MNGEPYIVRSSISIISLKSKVAITLHCQMHSTCYHPVWIEKYLKSNCVIKVAITKRKPLCATTKSTLFTVSKYEWNTKEGTR